MRRIKILPTILIITAAALALFPVLYLFANSFMSGAEILSRYGREITGANAGDFSSHGIHFVRFGLVPRQPSLEQYRLLLFHSPGYLELRAAGSAGAGGAVCSGSYGSVWTGKYQVEI